MHVNTYTYICTGISGSSKCDEQAVSYAWSTEAILHHWLHQQGCVKSVTAQRASGACDCNVWVMQRYQQPLPA